jgi:polysaccharide biosynthesis transport protein
VNVTSLPKEYISSIQSADLLTTEAERCSCLSGLIAELFDRSRRHARTSVMVTSPHRKAGVSFICSYIAAELASRGAKVLLVDAHALLDVRTLSSRSVTSLCRQVGPHYLWVLGKEETAGLRGGESKGRSSAIGILLHELERDFPYLLIDAPALSAGPDCELFATSVYGTVIVTRTNQTQVAELQKTYKALTALGGRVLGSVFNAHLSQK